MKTKNYKIHQIFSMCCCVLIVAGAFLLPWVEGDGKSYSLASFLFHSVLGEVRLRAGSVGVLKGETAAVFLTVTGGIIFAGVAAYAVYFVILLKQKRELQKMIFIPYYESLVVLLSTLLGGTSILLEAIIFLMFAEHFFGRMIEATIDLKREKRERELLMELRGEFLEQNYREMLELHRKSRKMYHDFKNEINVLMYYAGQGDLEKVKEYLRQIGEPVFTLETYAWTGNEMVDLILNHKHNIAVEKGIEFQAETEKVDAFGVDDLKLCVIFGNLLDNAIEAAEKAAEGNRWIRVKLVRHRGIVQLVIENSLAEFPIEENGRLVSRKKDGKIHGIGLQSVKESVEECGGTIEVHYNEEKFEVDVTFF